MENKIQSCIPQQMGEDGQLKNAFVAEEAAILPG